MYIIIEFALIAFKNAIIAIAFSGRAGVENDRGSFQKTISVSLGGIGAISSTFTFSLVNQPTEIAV